jgi:hypothetical protein
MTNIFTAGEFAQYAWIKNTWAFIFALAIDVNIVRLFLESSIERSKSAFYIGLGLAAVTGAALLIEGLQQSIGVQWSDQTVQFMIACLIGCRVVLVVVLMAREGYKLGKLIQQSVNSEQQTLERTHEQTEPANTQQPDSEPKNEPSVNTEQAQEVNHESEQETNVIAFTRKPSKRSTSTQKLNSVKKILANNPNATLPEIMKKAGVSKGYASQLRSLATKEYSQVAKG